MSTQDTPCNLKPFLVCLSLISRVKETIWEIKEKKRNFLWSLPPHSHSRAFKSPLPQIAMGGRRHNSPLLRRKTSLLLPQQKFFFVYQTRGRYLEISFLHSNATMCQISSTSRFVFPDFRVYLTSDLSDIDYTGPEFCKREKKSYQKLFC